MLPFFCADNIAKAEDFLYNYALYVVIYNRKDGR